ncbi:MAG: 50S ribosomal protein L10 [Ignavibacteriae bacterium]|nr:50S ribosomal protein L10 [Ignavibacteriota bacterium]
MKKSEKDQIIAEVEQEISKAQGLYFTDFSGITVEQVTELRREFRKAGCGYRVAKNTLIKKALERVTGYDNVYEKLVGPTGIAFGYEDPTAPARVIKKFNEKHGKLQAKVCVLDKQVFDGSQLDALSKLPSRNELIAGIIGGIQSPMAGLAGAISAVMRDLASVIGEIEKKKAA